MEELWREYSTIEKYGGMSLSSKRRPLFEMANILQDEVQKKEVQLEYDLLELGMEKYYYIEDLATLNQDEFEQGMKSFVQKHKDHFQFYNKRSLSTTNIADKWRYSLICWFYDRRRFHFLEEAEREDKIMTNWHCFLEELT